MKDSASFLRLWLVRLLVGIVLAWNLQASLIFIFSPASFVRAYELSGVSGEAAIRGFGILFLMWNVPYFFATINPNRYRLGLFFALWMQALGLFGESYIFFNLPAVHAMLRSSILRFISFDLAGMILLVFAYIVLKKLDPI